MNQGTGKAVAFTAEALDLLRSRLLDLTGRNRLLNFHHPKKRSLRVIDELPDQIVSTLLTGEEMRFQAVPEPTVEELVRAGYLQRDDKTGEIIRLRDDPSAKEWAEHLELATSYEVPVATDSDGAGKHSDKGIQTLFYPYELEARLKALGQASESAIQEMGTNILYLAVGFLEWYESKDSDNKHIAPLMLLPASLHKGRLNLETGTYQYTITYSGEDLIANLSLREKLRVDFGMALPDIDESTMPEVYLRQVHDLIGVCQPRWCVRRYITLALFNFSKLLMYLDLDPKNWPDKSSIDAHPVVSQILSRVGQQNGPDDPSSGSIAFGEEYAIDDIEQVHTKYPLIDDADSSQHSALIDAMDGKNLVIEGPPGTGKSQTITNLIAAAIAQGKTVLFVAEKLAALEVVRSRLGAAGIGEFCLELHSHKAQKRKLLDDIAQRVNKHRSYRHPEDIDADIARLEELKDELASYSEKMNRPWKKTGKTLHEVFAAATRYRNAICVGPDVVRPDGCTGENYDAAAQRLSKDRTQAYRKVYEAVARQLGDGIALQQHPWFGVSSVDLQIFDVEHVVDYLEAWQATLQALAEQREAIADALGCDAADVANDVDGARSFLLELERIPRLHGDELLDSLPTLRGKALEEALHQRELFGDIQRGYRALEQAVDAEVLRDLSLAEHLDTASETLEELVGSNVTLGRLAGAANKLASVNADLDALRKPLQALHVTLGGAADGYLTFSGAGLAECKTAIELIASLRPDCWEHRNPLFDNDELDTLLPQLRKRVDSLHEIERRLSDTFSIERATDERTLRELNDTLSSGGGLRWLKGSWRRAKRQLLSYAAGPRVRLKDLRELLPDAIMLATDRSKFEADVAYAEALGDLFQGQQSDVDSMEALRGWYKRVRREYGAGFGRRASLGEAILELPARSAGAVRTLARRRVPQQLSALLGALNELRALFTRKARVHSDDAPLTGEEGAIPDLLSKMRTAMDVCSPLADDDTRSVGDLRQLGRQLVTLHQKVRSWQEADLDNAAFGGRLGLELGPDKDNDPSLAALDHTLAMATYCDHELHNTLLADYVYRLPMAGTFARLSEQASRLHTAVDAESDARSVYAKRVELNEVAWSANAGGTLDRLIARNRLALNDPASLQSWLDYVRVRNQLDESGFRRLTAAVEECVLPIDEVEDACLAGTFDVLAREVLNEDRRLARFSGKSHSVLQEQFSRYDNRLKRLQRQKIAWAADRTNPPVGVTSGRVSELTELALLEHECAKQKRHIPVRQLLARAGHALLAIKPCFMMGPMSVAQYLAPGSVNFDLVIMDEASQIKPQDAIGAVARGGQLVVVGDPNQLPPTSFFDRLDDDDDDDSTGAGDAESILDAVWPLFHRRLLRWHYRSQHPDLIAFSNEFFYKDLVLFPSPYRKSDQYGIRYHRLPHGCFAGRRNMEEARIIAGAVRQHFRVSPGETLGVACMNAEQRLQIETAIESLAKDDPAFQSALDKDGERRESLFIKNLENVQGDERDVVFISMTYGPGEPGGRVMQRFGPINADTGWRRLNVLFTRARKGMHVFSSMGSADIVVDRSSRRGVKALHDFLSFCETGMLSRTTGPTGRPPDSDFEVAVMDALFKHGFDCVPQVGVAGFFIDAAVVDPGNPGRYLMGIECDGASYHSAKSTRDRDRLRQSILERLGWQIRRIWSTDWYRNPQAALAPILRELDDLKSAVVELDATGDVRADVEDILEAVDADGMRSQAIAYEEGSLREKLLRFDGEVVRKELPETPDTRRLLRPAMLEALLEYQPTSRAEFLEQVPRYLREGTESAEGKYLDQVFEIINASLEESRA